MQEWRAKKYTNKDKSDGKCTLLCLAIFREAFRQLYESC